MKTKHTKRSKTNTSTKPASAHPNHESRDLLNEAAEELFRLAHERLPDHVLQGALTGHEEDIRQDAILMALRWFLRAEGDSDHSRKPWCSPRAIAAALRFVKLDYVSALKRQAMTLQSMPTNPPITLHPVRLAPCDWPTPALQTMIQEAIKIALKDGRISHVNAGIALRVFVDLIPVRELAEQLKVHRSNIYQHLSRVRREIPDILSGIEVPLN